MNDSIYRISLDIHEHGSQAVLKAKKTDTGRKLHITLRSGGTPYTIEDDCYAVFKATKPDGSILYNACTIENNEIVYEFTEQTCTAVGRCRCEIALYGHDGNLITSPYFALLVDGTIYPDGRVESTDEFSALTKLVTDSIEAIENANDAADDANTAVTNANEATASANASAANTNEAARNANVATQNANKATTTANQAASAATQAAQNAVESAGIADESAGRANQAAENANDATEAANRATEDAYDAATKAAQTAKSLMVVGEARGTAIHLDDAIDQYLVGLRVFGKTTQGGTPTPEAPVELVSVGDDGDVETGIYGKNLLPGNQKAVGEAFVHGGISFVRNADNSITMNGTATEAAFYGLDYLGVETRYPTNTDLIASVSGLVTGVVMNIGYFDAEDAVFDSVASLRVNALSATYQLPKEAFRGRTYITVAKGTTLANVVIYPMIRLATVKDPTYEMYKAPSLVSANTPNGLPGIPVTSGGNYTDANGKQWICDEIDFARGVYVQRVGKSIVDGTRNLASKNDDTSTSYLYYSRVPDKDPGSPAFCTHFSHVGVYPSSVSNYGNFNVTMTPHIAFFGGYGIVSGDNSTTPNANEFNNWLKAQNEAGTPVTLLYALATPIETPLPEEELAAYDVLHTYRGNTTVFNDASAYMELEYVMDAKKYIDGLIAGTIIPATVE